MKFYLWGLALLFLVLGAAALVAKLHFGWDPFPFLNLGLAVMSALLLILVFAVAFARRHPADRIHRLLQEGKVEEAVRETEALVKERPDDPIVRINGTAAYARAGKTEEARRLLEGVDPQKLSGIAKDAYESWKRKLQ
jgi:membrane protein implicated in regulation of membrane protease activity